jgi:hypothetical protein
LFNAGAGQAVSAANSSMLMIRSTAMIIQNPDGTIIEAPTCHSPEKGGCGGYRVEVPADLLDQEGSTIDWLIGFAFDTLGAIHLDVRVHPAKGWPTATL